MNIFRSLFCLPQNLAGFPPTSVISHFHSFSPAALSLIQYHVVFSWSSVPPPFLLPKFCSQVTSFILQALNSVYAATQINILSSVPQNLLSNGLGVSYASSQLLNSWFPFPTSNTFQTPLSLSLMIASLLVCLPSTLGIHPIWFPLPHPLNHLQAPLYPKSFFTFPLLHSHSNYTEPGHPEFFVKCTALC